MGWGVARWAWRRERKNLEGRKRRGYAVWDTSSPSRAGGEARGGTAASPVGVAGGARLADWALSERRVRRRRGSVGPQHAAAQRGTNL